MDFINRFSNYIREVITELGMTSWPTKKELKKYTVIVIVGSAVTALILGGFDSIYTIIKKFFNF
ncbi:MAG TPA: preprotein translocase subunit SecE [Candidatus Pacearchaeota archaeon]|nr:preprotein translocase subunit SecE [Candidatus Parcubacteria bacterium]HNZ83985.1 preprotein translocase subunit SecE [Candidatus Pacearchaeota archaeon]HOU45874.1 preprotein translocase subunit SecE [Candidatus Pacearchaeota archaeon]HPM08337.1 preprotein translocase subunit SecE [Candidatus Pacearchaeota archaeon]HQI74335.1 preprotein translocase subunit SecE [Candidatus Pacearchaeota archaeon]